MTQEVADKYDAKAREIVNDSFGGKLQISEVVLRASIASALRSAAAEERDACAEIADKQRISWKHSVTATIIATAIRSRGDSNLVQSDEVQDEAQCDHLMEGEC